MENPIALIEAHKRRVDKLNENVEIGPNEISLDLLRAVYRSNHLPLHNRMRAAISALPHEVPKLGISVVVNDADIATRLDKALARIANAERKTINAETVVKPEPEPQPSAPMAPSLNRLYNKKLYRRI
jgi:hypothetical protein